MICINFVSTGRILRFILILVNCQSITHVNFVLFKKVISWLVNVLKIEMEVESLTLLTYSSIDLIR